MSILGLFRGHQKESSEAAAAFKAPEKPAVSPEVASAAQRARAKETDKSVLKTIDRVEAAGIVIPEGYRIVPNNASGLNLNITPRYEIDGQPDMYSQEAYWIINTGPKLEREQYTAKDGSIGPAGNISNEFVTREVYFGKRNEPEKLEKVVENIFVVKEGTETIQNAGDLIYIGSISRDNKTTKQVDRAGTYASDTQYRKAS